MKGYATLGLAILTLSACLSGAVSAPSEPDIYYRTQADADAALKAFDSANPDCQLWTNWQKMCSRTGEGGQVRCGQTVEANVKPSVPFCTAVNIYGGRRAQLDDPIKEIKSSLRFCDYPNGKPPASNMQALIEECVYTDKRPFNGQVLQELQHPWCKIWKKAGRSGRAGWYCASRKIPQWCALADGMGYGHQIGAPIDDKAIVLTMPTKNSRAVNGAYCARRM